MKAIFIDTNILIDFLADRKPFSEDAARLFDLSCKSKIRIYVSAVSYNNIYYILRQSNSHPASVKILTELSAWTEVLDVSKIILSKALESDFKDFEDSIQYQCALSNPEIELIVTRDSKHFKASTLPVLNAKEAFVLIDQFEK